MLYAAGKARGAKPLLFLGISSENVTRLVAGEPIHIRPDRLKAMGLPQMTIVIHYGGTEKDIIEDLKANGLEMESL